MDIDETHFSIKIQQSRTDQLALHHKEQANAVLEKVNVAQEEQQLQ